jgi:small-conductance mechanosensitive channel
VLQYLFFSHKGVGVPLLLVNIFSLIVSISLGLWLVSELFNVRLTPLLATSAAVSLVLGLALQDTLGNLFAGMAMQFDKPYEIGDWIEVHQGPQKWMGQVHEITWRAVTLHGFSDEVINIPNRIVAASQILNFAAHNRPFFRGTNFRVPYGIPLDQALAALAASAHGLPGVAQNPRPAAFVNELGESWVSLRLIYAISDYGSQNYTADGVIRAGLAALEHIGVDIAPQRLLLLNPKTEKAVG